MRVYDIKSIRNVAIMGDSGSGKSNFIEGLSFIAGQIKEPVRVEKEYKMSNSLFLNAVEYQNMKYNLLDIPGYIDFVGELESGLSAAASAILVVDATSDLTISTISNMEALDEKKLPRFIFINKVDDEKADYFKIIRSLKENFGKRIAPFHIPWGVAKDFKGHINVVDMYARVFDGTKCNDHKMPDDIDVSEIREMLKEAVAETSEELLEKYFEGIEFTTEELHHGLRKGVLNGSLIPVICGSSLKNIGLHTTFDIMREYLPSPRDNVKIHAEDNKFKAQVFKTTLDPFLGKLSYIKVISSEITPDNTVYNINKGEKEKINKIYTWVHDNLVELDKAVVGDIVVLNKLEYTENSDTLSENKEASAIEDINFPKEQMLVAIEVSNKADEDKLSSALHKLKLEDSTFYWRRVLETKQTVLGVQGEIHAEVLLNKLDKKYNVKVNTTELKVPYKETIKGRSNVQGKYKKQSGGHGQYGDVRIIFEPSDTEFEFYETIVGGAIPKTYIPAIEKGLIEGMQEGVLAKYPITNIKATLYDGTYHDVDSSEMSFKIAANMALKKGMQEANPILLEPIMELKITTPEEFMGDILSDISKKRGKILGIEAKNKKQVISATAPMAETFKYINDLKSMTQGRGKFEMNISKYEEVPSEITKKIIEENN
ncbi:elongation factor G [Oceanivirga miroungae]|uniref:Tr-type G domain-containing protein n=1 Tax=Oceanivirga miroungae TaxID=1130046 RepID=A0A6I8MAY8_9FUSO|nr:elongation factor G [Oceanivirga miroungae]VWL85915.1 hypothetical protein OMES3154_01200 [Oceanivirga miroungae]